MTTACLPCSLSCGFCLVIAEFTGRHPAPCKIVYTTTIKSPSPEGLFYGQKKARSEWRAGRMNIHQIFLLSCSDFYHL